jgi:ABC-type phosphate/phosphonate transport system permease subunit
LNLDAAAPQLAERSWTEALSLALRLVLALALVGIVVQAAIVVRARPQDLITGAYGMADIIRRAMPPDFGKIDIVWWPALETIDLAIFGTLGGVILALPLAVLAAVNVSPSRWLYYAARGMIGFARAVPTWSGHCCLSPPSGSGRFRAPSRFPFTRSGCWVACSPRRSSTWTWRRSMR